MKPRTTFAKPLIAFWKASDDFASHTWPTSISHEYLAYERYPLLCANIFAHGLAQHFESAKDAVVGNQLRLAIIDTEHKQRDNQKPNRHSEVRQGGERHIECLVPSFLGQIDKIQRSFWAKSWISEFALSIIAIVVQHPAIWHLKQTLVVYR